MTLLKKNQMGKSRMQKCQSSFTRYKRYENYCIAQTPNTLRAGLRYIRTWLNRYAAGMFFCVTLERARRCLKGCAGKTMHARKKLPTYKMFG